MKREYKYEWDVLWLKCTKCWERNDASFYNNQKKWKFWLSSICKECKRKERIEHRERYKEYFKEYAKANKDRLREYKQNYKLLNREKIVAAQKKYSEENKEKIAAYKKEWYVKNMEQRKQYSQSYYKEHKESIKTRVRTYEKINRDKVYKRSKAYRDKNKDKINQYFKDYYEYNKDGILKKHKEWINDFESMHGFNLWTFHTKTRRYVNKFKLRPIACPICWNNEKIEIHHPSYDSFDKWSEVVFCCRACHKLIHYGTIECPKPINLLTLTNYNHGRQKTTFS